MIVNRVTAAPTAAIVLAILIAGCQGNQDQGGVSKQDVSDVASLLADTAGAMNTNYTPPSVPPPRMVFTRQDIPNEGGYLQVSIGDVSDDQANRFMRRLKAENCTCGCPHTIDQCLIEDPQCDVAHNLARQVLKEVTEGS